MSLYTTCNNLKNTISGSNPIGFFKKEKKLIVDETISRKKSEKDPNKLDGRDALKCLRGLNINEIICLEVAQTCQPYTNVIFEDKKFCIALCISRLAKRFEDLGLNFIKINKSFYVAEKYKKYIVTKKVPAFNPEGYIIIQDKKYNLSRRVATKYYKENGLRAIN